jgi:hypothetical protein
MPFGVPVHGVAGVVRSLRSVYATTGCGLAEDGSTTAVALAMSNHAMAIRSDLLVHRFDT